MKSWSDMSPVQRMAARELLTRELAKREIAKRRTESLTLTEFVKQAWPIVEPGKTYLHNWHIDAIAEHLEAVTRGEITRLLINVPFRFMKSTLVSVMWPAWTWTNRPEHQWLCGSYAAKLAIRDSRKMRNVIESPWYRERWGDRFKLTSDQNQKIRFENDRTGYRIAFGFEGGVMGDGGDTVLIDDPHDRNQAHSEAERETSLVTFDEAITTRLNQPASSSIVIIMQRLHEQDLSGHVLERGGYEHLLIPMHFDPKRARVTVTGWTDPRKEVGELAWPEQFPADTVLRIERDLGSYAAAGQLEQSPSPAAGGIFQRSWWKWYTALPDKFDEVIQSWDFAVKDTNDYVVGQVWGRIAGQFYLIDQVRGRMDFPSSVQAFRAFSAKHPTAITKLVEDKANGPAIIATVKAEIPGIIAVNPDGDKKSRALAVTPCIEAGNAFLPDPSIAPWIHDYVEEHAAFPNASHDDQVDTTTQALHRMLHGIGKNSGVMEWFRQKVDELAPKISTITPPSGSADGGETLTLTGERLGGAEIEIDGAKGRVLSMSEIEIRFLAPPHLPGAVNILVKTPSGTATARSGYTYL